VLTAIFISFPGLQVGACYLIKILTFAPAGIMKDLLKRLFQSVLGFRNYLYIFSVFKILTLRMDRKENDFFHFLELLPERGIILDVGANIGIMAVHLSRSRPNSSVHCFEPIQENFSTLQRVIAFFRLRNAVAHPLALSDTPGRLRMLMPVSRRVKFQGLSHVIHDDLPQGEGRVYEVPACTLDSMEELLNGGLPVTAIKIDVENHESNVLKGAENLIKKYRPVIYCELWENENREKSISFMNALGYRCKVLRGNALVDFEPGGYPSQNFFFLPGEAVKS
jgi:FkbM family methyltransferase